MKIMTLLKFDERLSSTLQIPNYYDFFDKSQLVYSFLNWQNSFIQLDFKHYKQFYLYPFIHFVH